jgi:peptidoglycan/LPS O-acetylase OafA/YrhL
VGLLARTGKCSYTIYLWHMPVLIWGVPLLDPLDDAGRGVVYFAGALVVGAVMAPLTEQPLLRLRDRWAPQNMFDRNPPYRLD